MLKLNPNMKREPFGGHHYPQYGMTFRGDTLGKVIIDLTAFRLNNNIPAGSPEQDVLNYYAEKFPYMVMADEDRSDSPQDRDYTLWRDWIYGAWRRPPKKFVSVKEASNRWEICLVCPMHRPTDWTKTDESRELSRRSFLLTRGVDTPAKLGYCRLHHCDLSAFVFIDGVKEFSAKKDGEELESCWVK